MEKEMTSSHISCVKQAATGDHYRLVWLHAIYFLFSLGEAIPCELSTNKATASWHEVKKNDLWIASEQYFSFNKLI